MVTLAFLFTDKMIKRTEVFLGFSIMNIYPCKNTFFRLKGGRNRKLSAAKSASFLFWVANESYRKRLKSVTAGTVGTLSNTTGLKLVLDG